MGYDEDDRRQKSRRREAEPHEGGVARGLRLQELIREEVDLLLRNEARDRRLEGVSITMVELSADGSRARLWFSAPEDSDALEALEGAAGFLRGQLAEGLGLKRTPDLRFRRDPATRSFASPATGAGDGQGR